MKTHTSNFKDEIKQYGKQIDSIVSYTLNDELIELGSEELNSITPSYKGDILKSVMKELFIDSNVEIPVGTILNYKFGVLVNDEDMIYDYVDFGDYIVKEVTKKEDTGSYEIKCYDFMLRSMNEYHKLSNGAFPMTIDDYIKKICNDLSLEFANGEEDNYTNKNRIMNYDVFEEIGYTYRDIFDDLAEVVGGTICINKDNKVEIRYINDTEDEIDEEYLKDINVNFGEKYGKINSIVLSRSAGSDNVYLQDEASIEANGLCELKIVDNQIMNLNDRSDYLPGLLRRLDGLEYYINDFSSPGICYYDLCDRYNVKIGDLTYSCVMLNDEINVTQGLEENIHTEIPNISETDYKYADTTDKRINQTYLIVDKQNQKIEGAITKVDGQESKITQINADIEGLRAQIGTVADVTTTSDGIGVITLENLLTSEAIYLQVHPTISDINYKITNQTIVSQNTLLTSPTIYFEQVVDGGDNPISKFLLPTSLYIYDSDTYDEYIIDYEKNRRYVIHRVGIDSNGNKYKLANPYEEEFEYLSYKFPVDGTYNIYFKSFPYAYIKCRAMVSNIYTSQYATRVELDSRLEITEREVNAQVTEKVGKNEIIAKINAAIKDDQGIVELTGNSVIINSDNFKLTADGTVETKNGKFSGEINIKSSDTEKREDTKFIVQSSDGKAYTYINPNYMRLKNDNSNTTIYMNNSLGLLFLENENYHTTISPGTIKFGNTTISPFHNNETYSYVPHGNPYFASYCDKNTFKFSIPIGRSMGLINNVSTTGTVRIRFYFYDGGAAYTSNSADLTIINDNLIEVSCNYNGSSTLEGIFMARVEYLTLKFT